MLKLTTQLLIFSLLNISHIYLMKRTRNRQKDALPVALIFSAVSSTKIPPSKGFQRTNWTKIWDCFLEVLNERVTVKKIVTRWAMCRSRMLPSSYPIKLQLTFMKYNKCYYYIVINISLFNPCNIQKTVQIFNIFQNFKNFIRFQNFQKKSKW
jgi:hypothetical protein